MERCGAKDRDSWNEFTIFAYSYFCGVCVFSGVLEMQSHKYQLIQKASGSFNFSNCIFAFAAHDNIHVEIR